MSGMLDVYPLSERHMRLIVSQKYFSDGAPNIVKAINDTYSDHKHLYCFAHMLNLIHQKAISNIPTLVSLLTKIKQIVTFLKHSVVASDKLTSLQLQDGTNKESILKLKQEVPTRWNSTFYMLERFKLLAISMVLFEIPNSPSMINVTELNDLKDIIYLLKPLELVTKDISGQNYITTSKVIPLVHTIMYKVENLDAKSDVGKALRKEFKKAHFKIPIANSNVIQYVNKELKKIIDSDKQTTQHLRPDPSLITERNEDDGNDLWSYHKQVTSNHSNGIASSNSDMEPELRQYLDLPLVKIDENVLEVWETYKSVFPNLFKLAQKYFSSVASSVPSERLFSKAGNILTEKRNRISEKRLSKLCLLQTIADEYWDI
ncbi:PREDICTED: zinc finger BED domain-containing protein 4-like [Diuraphis noxia]|uniref:zinc finger BED domain-containing protein 4-like n=1 Tax=Diuraphis noxia TaxID=143948 RepID=UPI0007635C65|nr:PREDICTED: zinc finger BED domain-containing protein 4-like [Diuraphis noxia]